MGYLYSLGEHRYTSYIPYQNAFNIKYSEIPDCITDSLVYKKYIYISPHSYISIYLYIYVVKTIRNAYIKSSHNAYTLGIPSNSQPHPQS